ncbi:MAG: hypothetical protein WC523_05000 [Patescibacteria group bacterium]
MLDDIKFIYWAVLKHKYGVENYYIRKYTPPYPIIAFTVYSGGVNTYIGIWKSDLARFKEQRCVSE